MIGKRSVEIAVEFKSLEFDVLPKVYLRDRERDAPDAVAHIGLNNEICYAHEGSVILDRYKPAESALAVVEMTKKALERSLSEDALTDLKMEFPQHWMPGKILHVALDSQAPPGPAQVFTIPRDKELPLEVLSRDSAWLDSFPAEARKSVIASRRPASFLRTNSLFEAPPGRPPTTFGELLDWAAAFDRNLYTAILNSAQSFFGELPTLAISTPLGVVGAELLLTKKLKKSIQRRAGHEWAVDHLRGEIPILRLTGSPIDQDYILGRNLGTRPSLANLRIVVIGCGTIGGYLARQLAQSGAGRYGLLTLVDPDLFMAGNVGRHLLGLDSIGLRKTDALVHVLEKDFPGSNFRSIPKRFLHCVEELVGADLVVDATGEEGVSLALNHFLLRQDVALPTTLFVYLCGSGKAAQALLMAPKSGDACFKCMRPDLFGGRREWPLSSVSDDDGIPASCGESAYVPFAVAAPSIAAGLATAMCLDWVSGNPSPKLRTIRIDHNATIEIKDTDPPIDPACPACQLPSIV
ncbi:MAG: ThiF family adenylyltransferase [Thermohalobaculum sp.]